MTYWVIARFSNTIYMAADVRVSCPYSSEMPSVNPQSLDPRASGALHPKNFADFSEKLFGCEYQVLNGPSIRFGLCTSGYASCEGYPTISDILRRVLVDIFRRKIPFTNGECLMKFIVRNIYEKYVQLYNGEPFGKYVVENTCFGLGLYVSNTSFIASWNTKQIQAHNQEGYLEADFSGNCLYKLYPRSAPFFPATQREILDYIEHTTSPYAKPKSIGVDFIRGIIYTAAKTNVIDANAAQVISSTTDIAIISARGFVLHINPKQDTSAVTYETPITYGSDRVFDSRGLVDSVGNRIDIESLLSGRRTTPTVAYPSSFSGNVLGKSSYAQQPEEIIRRRTNSFSQF